MTANLQLMLSHTRSPKLLSSGDTCLRIKAIFRKLAAITNAVNSTLKLPDVGVLRLHFHVIAAATLPTYIKHPCLI